MAKSGGRYERSLEFLAKAKAIAAEMFDDRAGDQIVTKTGIIVGMGEEMHGCWRCFATWRIARWIF